MLKSVESLSSSHHWEIHGKRSADDRNERIKTGSLVCFRIVEEEVLAALDEAEFSMRLTLRFVAEPGEDDQDEDDVAKDIAEWGAFGFMLVLGVLFFAEARPASVDSRLPLDPPLRRRDE